MLRIWGVGPDRDMILVPSMQQVAGEKFPKPKWQKSLGKKKKKACVLIRATCVNSDKTSMLQQRQYAIFTA